MVALKIRPNGNSASVLLPKEVLARMHVEINDTIYLTEAPDGGYRITPYAPGFEDKMKVAERVMRKRRNLLKALANA